MEQLFVFDNQNVLKSECNLYKKLCVNFGHRNALNHQIYQKYANIKRLMNIIIPIVRLSSVSIVDAEIRHILPDCKCSCTWFLNHCSRSILLNVVFLIAAILLSFLEQNGIENFDRKLENILLLARHCAK